MNIQGVTETHNVLKFIQDNFQSTDLIAFDVQLATGVHERKISGIIKEYVGMNFKQYVNHLKIELAKKLLRDIDTPLSVISLKCGYNNIPHFQKVFMDVTGVPVNEYRIREKEAVIA